VANNDGSGMSLSDALGVVRRSVWLIICVALVAAVGAYVFSRMQTPMYAASAQLLYEQAIDPTLSGSGQTYTDPNAQQLRVEAAATVITGPDVSSRVAKVVGSKSEPPYSVSATATAAAGSTSTYSTGVLITVTSPSAEWSYKLANAYANQFIQSRQESQRDAYSQAADIVKQQLSDYSTPDQKASSEYVILQQRLRNLQLSAATATGDFVVVVPATVPSAPYAPKPVRSAAMALVVGLIAATGIAFLRDRLDTRVRDYGEVRQILDLPVIGRVPTIAPESLKRGPLVILTEGDGAAANALRLVRSNLEFVNLGDENSTLMVASALKGEGKSVLIANLAVSLALSGKRVLLVDGDLRRPQVHRLLNLRNAVGLSSVIAGKDKLANALQTFEPVMPRVTVNAGASSRAAAGQQNEAAPLAVLTAGPLPPNPGEMVASQRFSGLMQSLRGMDFDMILLDSPAFLAVGDASAMAASCDGIVLVVNLKHTRRPVLDEAREFLSPMPSRKLGFITVGDKTTHDEAYLYYAEH
jgi:capsular exopolysaccharide synthesis family protein